MNVRGIVFAAAMAVASVGASATAVLVNGGFESGLTGWAVTGGNSGGCDTNFNASTTGTASGCSGYAPIPAAFVAPASGSYAAYASFDGNGPEHHTITQAFGIAAGTTMLDINWQDALGFGNGWIFPQPRVYSVNLLKADGTLEATLLSESFTNQSGGILQGWTTHDINASIYLSDLGAGGKLQFDLYVPQSFTGPGVFALDNVAVTTTTTVPEPASLALAGLALFGLALTLRAKRR